MTLRARLTGAFLALVMGPVLVGAIFVGGMVNAANQSRQRERLDVATTSLRAAIDATCERLQAEAETAAVEAVGGHQPAAAQTLVDQGRPGAVYIVASDDTSVGTSTGAPAPPWAMCTPPLAGEPARTDDAYHALAGEPARAEDAYHALAAVAQTRDAQGRPTGNVYAAQALDLTFVDQLAAAAGVGVTILYGTSLSSEPPAVARHVSEAARGLAADHVGKSSGRYVRRLDPTPNEPLAIAVSVPVTTSTGLFTVIAALVLVAALVAIGSAWALARGTTRSLHEITEAAGRVARGELDTRVPVRYDDEVGHLGAAFNRMTREMQSYVAALVASRDQLRGNLDMLGDTLSSTHDLPRILRVILASAVSATGANAGLVMLADPTDGSLRFQCAEGFDPDVIALLEPLTIASGDGLAGGVAATGVARRGRIVDGRPVLAAGEPSCHTYLAVPLRVPPVLPAQPGTPGPLAYPAQSVPLPPLQPRQPSVDGYTSGVGGVRGVLALYDRLGDDEFDDTDLRTVRTFAGHAAVAVDNVRLHDEAQRLSHTDALTGLYNYRHLNDLLRREVHRSSRFGHCLCVMVLDLDRFKEVNDTYGHTAGDAVLVEFARRIGAEIRGVDLAFRYGGEEFVLLLPETDGSGGITLARRLGTAVRGTPITVTAGRGHTQTGDHAVDIAVTVSIGVAVFPQHGTNGAEVLEAADDALYAAKAGGRDTFRLAISPAGPTVDVARDMPASLARGPDRVDDVSPAVIGGRGSGWAGNGWAGSGWAGNGRAGGAPADGESAGGRSPGGASGGPQPPRQSRGR